MLDEVVLRSISCGLDADAVAVLLDNFSSDSATSLCVSTSDMLQAIDRLMHDAVQALREAATNGRPRIVDHLLATNTNLRCDPCSLALREAASGGHAAIVQSLLAHGVADPDYQAGSAMCAAVKHGHAPVVAHLLHDARVNLGRCSYEALCSIANMGHPPAVIVGRLLDGIGPPIGSSKPKTVVLVHTWAVIVSEFFS